jgi:histidinol-phosphate/aromatic aminotransferase/cobyric acid decarboxylase-like protein
MRRIADGSIADRSGVVSLAIDTYRAVPTLGDAPGLLNLSWTLDEREWLAADLDALAAGVLERELASGLQGLHRYLVKDPYGSETLGPAVEAYFGLPGLAPHVSCAAGVNGLLHGLAGLAGAEGVAMADNVYPDFAHWLTRRGIAIRAFDAATPQALDVWSSDRGLIHLERPALFTAPWDSLDALRALCARLPQAIVLIDESNANYCPPAFSAATLTATFDNLIVLRGLSKAYGMGSLRLGYAVSSPTLTASVRAQLPALGVSSLSLLIGSAILACGDICGPLRTRIAEAKAHMRASLAACGVGPDALLPAGEALPYLLCDALPAPLDTAADTATMRIGVKRHPLWSAMGPRTIHRCSVPLRAARMALLQARFAEASAVGQPDRG